MTDTALRSGEFAPTPPPSRSGRLASIRYAWRQLTSMRIALLLLFLLALGAVPGSLLPQRGLNPGRVAEFYLAHHTLAPVLDRLSLFDVFAAPWFAAIYLALFVSLAGCVVPRMWRHAAVLQARPPAAPRHLSRLPHAASWEVSTPAADVVSRAAADLRGWRVDVAAEPGGGWTLAAERGHLKEVGNLVFHLALLLLLLGIALGGLFGYKGNVLVKEGDGFSNTLPAYDSFTPGRLFSARSLAPYTVVLDDFRATYQSDGQAATFDAAVRYASRPGAAMRRDDLRVNSPLEVGGTKVYLLGHGYAPHFVVRVPGLAEPVFDAAVPFLPRDASFASDGVVKVPDVPPAPDGTGRQLAFSGFFTPTTILTPRGVASGFPAARDPAVTLLAWRGDLGLDNGRPQSVYALDTRGLRRVTDDAGRPVARTLRPGDTMLLPGGAGRITFTGYAEFATLQITHDPGRQLALLAAGFVVGGLVLTLAVRRRRLWLRARPVGSTTVIEAGGLGRGDGESTAADFGRTVRRLQYEARKD